MAVAVVVGSAIERVFGKRPALKAHLAGLPEARVEWREVAVPYDGGLVSTDVPDALWWSLRLVWKFSGQTPVARYQRLVGPLSEMFVDGRPVALSLGSRSGLVYVQSVAIVPGKSFTVTAGLRGVGELRCRSQR